MPGCFLSLSQARAPHPFTLSPPPLPLLLSPFSQLGFFGILLVEAVTGKGIFEMLGFKVGQGLGFEF